MKAIMISTLLAFAGTAAMPAVATAQEKSPPRCEQTVKGKAAPQDCPPAKVKKKRSDADATTRERKGDAARKPPPDGKRAAISDDQPKPPLRDAQRLADKSSRRDASDCKMPAPPKGERQVQRDMKPQGRDADMPCPPLQK
ncbi:hypothetical protein FQV27_11450 [Paracoccus aurantiacus]|uniref:Uncharacterized protein n=1 Tax=Paracoccus aurantiacus TaxID=2599412 RepID=A0A5C6S2X1_9RHOB|nr:hypothetical protein [Paracoccus aurantiacus]TXB68596.1 hypothetical protein FQV27_11450 [Paracoccus aurantiacus]